MLRECRQRLCRAQAQRLTPLGPPAVGAAPAPRRAPAPYVAPPLSAADARLWAALDPQRRALGGAPPRSAAAAHPPSLTSDACAVDYGRVKTGVAASRGGAAPRPVATLRLPGASDALLDALQRIAEEEEVTELVVGLPLLYGPGGEARCTDQTAWAERFAGRMAARLPAARVWLVDESHSSSMAAAFILQRYFAATAPPRRVHPPPAAAARAAEVAAARAALATGRRDALAQLMSAAPRPPPAAAPPRRSVDVALLRRRPAVCTGGGHSSPRAAAWLMAACYEGDEVLPAGGDGEQNGAAEAPG